MTNREHTEKLKKQAIEAFKDHVVIEASPAAPSMISGTLLRWFIAKLHKNGGYDSIYMTEIIILRNGRLFVGGDIDDVIFAYGDKDSHARLQWIGNCEDVDYYVLQKAKIGLSDGGKLTEDYSAEVAKEQLESLFGDAQDEETGAKSPYLEQIQEALQLVDDQPALMEFVYDNLSEHELDYLGRVCSARVVYAWAAVRRLCELLDLRSTTSVTEVKHNAPSP